MTKENEPPSDITFKTHKADVTFDLHYPRVIFGYFPRLNVSFFPCESNQKWQHFLPALMNTDVSCLHLERPVSSPNQLWLT